MTRSLFGATPADFVIAVGGDRLLRTSSATLTFWDAAEGGSQYTDLLLDGVPVTEVKVPSNGSVPLFEGPDEITQMWVDAGGSERLRITAGGARGPAGVADDGSVAALVADDGSATATALDARIVTVAPAVPSLPAKVAAGRAATARKTGPVTTDLTAVTPNATPAGTFTEQYFVVGNVRDADWPADEGEGYDFAFSNQVASYASSGQCQRSIRFMADGDAVLFRIYATLITHGFRIYVDGVPTSTTPYSPGVTGLSYVEITFPSAKPRLIEVRTNVSLLSMFTEKPYRLWKPVAQTGPRVLVIGDSFTQGAGATTSVLNGIYNDIGPALGTEEVWVDAIGGTGYGVTAAANGTDAPLNRFIDRVGQMVIPAPASATPPSATWDVADIDPDLVIVHGGGLNDLSKSRTVTNVVDDATTTFETLRTKLPDAKLVFVEGFAAGAIAGFNTAFTDIRTQLQTALAATGVYYIDVATTAPWIAGTGTVAAPTGDGNADVYLSADGVHPSDAGHLYIRGRLVPRLRAVLDDDGTLLNSLI